jgi:hypothetical protein
MRYQVPQFINIEDKIFGPLTLKQFLYVAGGSALAFIIWNALPSFIAIFFAVPVGIFFFALAFYQYNDRPFIYTVEGAFKYFFTDKLYIWKKEDKKPKKQAEVVTKEAEKMNIPKLSDSKLKELSWSLDINNSTDNKPKDNLKI